MSEAQIPSAAAQRKIRKRLIAVISVIALIFKPLFEAIKTLWSGKTPDTLSFLDRLIIAGSAEPGLVVLGVIALAILAVAWIFVADLESGRQGDGLWLGIGKLLPPPSTPVFAMLFVAYRIVCAMLAMAVVGFVIYTLILKAEKFSSTPSADVRAFLLDAHSQDILLNGELKDGKDGFSKIHRDAKNLIHDEKERDEMGKLRLALDSFIDKNSAALSSYDLGRLKVVMASISLTLGEEDAFQHDISDSKSYSPELKEKFLKLECLHAWSKNDFAEAVDLAARSTDPAFRRHIRALALDQANSQEAGPALKAFADYISADSMSRADELEAAAFYAIASGYYRKQHQIPVAKECLKQAETLANNSHYHSSDEAGDDEQKERVLVQVRQQNGAIAYEELAFQTAETETKKWIDGCRKLIEAGKLNVFESLQEALWDLVAVGEQLKDTNTLRTAIAQLKQLYADPKANGFIDCVGGMQKLESEKRDLEAVHEL